MGLVPVILPMVNLKLRIDTIARPREKKQNWSDITSNNIRQDNIRQYNAPDVPALVANILQSIDQDIFFNCFFDVL